MCHVEAHLADALDAASLADRASLSRHHFHRVFAAHVGLSVAEFITYRRLQRATQMLQGSAWPVAEVAWAVGYDTAQALAKAMRRELGVTPTQARGGAVLRWLRLPTPAALPPTLSPQPIKPMQPVRFAHLPPGIQALTATARGMVGRSLSGAAQQAFGELMDAAGRAGLLPRVRSCIALVPDDPEGPDDPQCRYVAGLVFGHNLATLQGACEQPALPLRGSLAWWPLAPGRYAVFSHIGPYTTLHQAWDAIYRDWLPASGEKLRDVPPMELCLNSPADTPPEKLHTEIWLPLR